jgi:hypothetical protein
LHFIAKSTLSLYGRKRKNANFGAYKKMPTLLVLWDQLRAWKRKRQETPGNGVQTPGTPPKNLFFAYLMSVSPQYIHLLVLWDPLRAWKRKRQETPGNGVPPKNIFFAYLMSAPPQYKGDATFCTGTAYLIKLANKLNQINLLK